MGRGSKGTPTEVLIWSSSRERLLRKLEHMSNKRSHKVRRRHWGFKLIIVDQSKHRYEVRVVKNPISYIKAINKHERGNKSVEIIGGIDYDGDIYFENKQRFKGLF